MNKIKMLNGNVLLRLDIPEKKDKGALYVPSKTAQNYKVGTVVSPDINNTLKEGDVVYIPLASGLDVTIEKEKYVIVNVREIILIL